MKYRFRSLLALMLIALPAPLCADITLDDFEAGSLSLSTIGTQGPTYDSEVPGAGTAGPLRLAQHVPGVTALSTLTTEIQGGDLVVDFNVGLFEIQSYIHGIYGGFQNGVPTSGAGEVEDNDLVAIVPQLDLSQETEIRLQYSLEGNGIVIVTFYAFGGTTIDGNLLDESSANPVVLEAGENNEAVLPLASLFNNVDPSQVSGVGFTMVTGLSGQVTFHNFECTGAPTSASVTPDEFLVTRGNYVSGGVAELAASDNADLAVTRSGTDLLGNIDIEIKGISPNASPSRLDMDVESAVFARSAVEKFVDYWNFDTSDWEQVAAGTATRLSDSTLTATPGGDLSRFVETGTGCIRARIRYSSVARRQRYSANIDHTVWTIE